MIITLTANPSLDRTIELGAPLAHGAVQRAVGAVQDPGGKGVNISRALQVSGVPTLAIVPGEADLRNSMEFEWCLFWPYGCPRHMGCHSTCCFRIYRSYHFGRKPEAECDLPYPKLSKCRPL